VGKSDLKKDSLNMEKDFDDKQLSDLKESTQD